MKVICPLAAMMLALVSCSKTETNVAPPPQPEARPAQPSATKTTLAQNASPEQDQHPGVQPTPPAPLASESATPAASSRAAEQATALPAPPDLPGVSTNIAGRLDPTGAALGKPDPSGNSPASTLDKLGKIVSNLTNLANTKPTPSTNPAPGASRPVGTADLATDQITRGLKEALARGLDHAISQLGKDGGYLTNAAVRIPMPEKLQAVEKLLRRAGQDKLADDFVTTMNRAAEKAVPAAAGVFTDSLKQMTVEDARGILQGPKDAATQYFRRTAGPQVQEKFKPIVAEATSQAGVTAAYKNLTDKVGLAGAFLKQESLDLDDYVATKASDGLFKMVAEQEKKIRENPMARTTDLLKSVFGAQGK